MTSIVDKYEASTTRTQSSYRSNRSTSTSSSTDILKSSALKTDEIPIFTKSKINFRPPQAITHLTICNNMLCMVMSDASLMRINLKKPDDVDEIELGRNGEEVYKVYLDPTGRFLLIVFTNEETSFLSFNSKKPKTLHKLKGHQIESVGWCKSSSSNSTGPILIGTKRGLIMESCIETGEDTKFFGGSVDQYCKQLYNVNKVDQKGLGITSIQFFYTAILDNGSKECCLLVSTSSRLLQFSGTINFSSGEVPVFQSFFSSYNSLPPRYIDLQPEEIGNRQLVLFYNSKKDTASLDSFIPEQFGWLVPQGIYLGDIKIPPSNHQDPNSLFQRSLISNARIIPYPDFKQSSRNRFEETNYEVLDFVITQFHILLLYSDRLRVICSLNEQLIFEDIYTSRYGQLIKLIQDPIEGTMWAYTEKAVFKYKVNNESRDVWQIYLNMGKFDLAQKYCQNDQIKLDKVLSSQAENAFQKGKYQESALYYAVTQKSFEEVALKFINHGKECALRSFLEKKLSTLKQTDITQMVILSTWLVELYLNQIGILKNELSYPSDQYQKCRESLHKLLSQDRLREVFQENRSTIYNLFTNHGDIENYVFFAVLMQDYERVVSHYIQNKNYEAALESLQRQNSISLYYKFSPILMQKTPSRLVDAWISLGRKIDPLQLIPSLINRSQNGDKIKWNEAIRYLKYSTQQLNCTDPAIHNYLLSLYVNHQPNELISYLKEQGEDKEEVCYDIKYALRLCLMNEDKVEASKEILIRACVFIYTIMGLYEEAVGMALKVDVELAKSIIDRSELDDDNEEIKKKLWLKIARHVVEEEKDIKRAMLFLQVLHIFI